MKYFSTFSGAGGFDLGLKQYDCVGFSEIDKYASAVLKHKFPNIKNYGDIKTINWSTVPDFDLLIGGSPCQDLSVAGKRKGLTGERSGLFAEFIRALQEKKPSYFIWENVKGALSSNAGWDFAEVQAQMAECGYELWWQVLNAKDFGVPQNRERIFIVGSRTGSPREILFERGAGEQDIEKDVRVYDDYNSKFREDGLAGTLTTNTGSKAERNGQKIVQVNRPKHSNDRVYSDEGISPTLNTMQGGNRQPFVARAVLTPDRAEKRQNGRRMKEDGEPSFTLTSQDKHGVYDGTKIRRLTPRECERLMSWPDDWTRYGDFDGEIKEISDTQRYKMCGNGVVSEVVKVLASELLDYANR